MKNRGLFFVFEGGEGSGKTTQAKMLADWLSEKRGFSVILTKEPGGDEGVCRDIRKLLLDPKYKGRMDHIAELFLFEADRAQHLNTVIRPALTEGQIVICDRFRVSTIAYQYYARDVVPYETLAFLDRVATLDFQPDFTIYLDIDPSIGLKRNADSGKRNRFEMEDLDFHQKLRDGYLDYFKKFAKPETWKRLDATLPIQMLHENVLTAILGNERLPYLGE